MPAATTPDRTGPLDALPPVDDLSYEEARDELVRVVARLEAGAATLEESLALWERGEALAERCRTWLEGARRRLERGAAHDAARDTAHDTDGGDAAPGDEDA